MPLAIEGVDEVSLIEPSLLPVLYYLSIDGTSNYSDVQWLFEAKIKKIIY